jgi:hypothetical protein
MPSVSKTKKSKGPSKKG